MSKSDIYRLFNVFIENENISETDLLCAGISREKIDDFVKNSVISKLGIVYILKRNCVTNLLNYGDILYSKGHILKASKCYNLCVKLNPKSKAKNRKFIIDVRNKDFKEAFSYFDLDRLSCSSMESFYLYILGLINPIPKEFHLFIKKYISDYRENKFKLPEDFKKVIKAVFNCQFNIALSYLNEVNSDNNNEIKKEVCSILIKSCKEKYVNLEQIYYFLSVDKLDIAFELAIDYLYDNGKGEYSRLVKSLIYLSYEMGDKSYKLPMDILSNLDDIKLDYNYFLSMFNEAFKSNSIKKAKLLLKILQDLNKLGYSSLDLSGLEMSLSKLK